MLALEHLRLAGYMLTGNRSMFLEIDERVAWLQFYPTIHSPHHTINQCYDRIPILYKKKIQFVDPITRQTYPHATVQKCSYRINNQLDTDQKDFLYSLTPGIVHQGKPEIFGPEDLYKNASHSFTGSQNAGMYTRNELRCFWDGILINAVSRTALKLFS